MSKDFRTESDTMGEMQVPNQALYGASTQRAVLNFPVSDLRLGREFTYALGLIKYSAAESNFQLGSITEEQKQAIQQAAEEVMAGELDEHFVVDVFQTGSGTSSNMNTNEVIANRASEILGGKIGDKLIHPNDHVNMSQSSNDVFPSAMHIACVATLNKNLKPALKNLQDIFSKKATEFSEVIKSGRTHLQDATPITLGQEFSAFATQSEKGLSRICQAEQSLLELALGGTAVGSGLNTHPDFAKQAINVIAKKSGYSFTEAENHFEAQASKDALLELSGQLRCFATAFMKIADDIRWLAAGPRCSLAEIFLPEIQPGSSIMPAKVNPVICESTMMAMSQIIGNDTTIAICNQRGNLQLNVMMPVMAYNLLQSIELLASTANNFVDKCLSGIAANKERCAEYAENSLATCTSLAPIIGYEQAAKVAKKAHKENISVKQAAQDLAVLPHDDLEKALNLFAMTKPQAE